MAKRKVKLAASHSKKGSRAVASVALTDFSPGSQESVSPRPVEDDETSLNKYRRGISHSLSSTPPTSAVNTPEPTANQTGRVRRSRTAKTKLPASLLESTSHSSELDTSSVSDYVVSADQSDAITETESATDCQPTEDTDADDEDHLILPAAKRIKPNIKSQASKRALASREFYQSCLGIL